MIEEQRGECRDPRETRAGEHVERIGDANDLSGGKSALVTAIELIAFGVDAGEQRLNATNRSRRDGRLGGLLPIEDGPIIWPKLGGGVSFIFRDLHEMSDMAEAETGPMRRPRAFHVDRDSFGDPPSRDRLAERAVAPHLLGHREDL